MTAIMNGLAADGKPPSLYTLSNASGMEVTVMDVGATWLSCKLPIDDEKREVLLGVDTMEDFARQKVFLGATVGRFANRIAGGRFKIDGHEFQAVTNQSGNSLHGGLDGFDKRRWNLVEKSDNSVELSLVSADGDQGFPGELMVSVRYSLSEQNQVLIDYSATTTAATPVNLTNHAYFNLLGAESEEDILGHSLQIRASHYLPTQADGIPFTEPEAVAGTSFDFNMTKPISTHLLADEQQRQANGYDHCYVLESQGNEPVARLVSPDSRVEMSVFTTKPGMQLYTGNWLANTPNRLGGLYKDYQGVALETQFYPDSPNRGWKESDAILRPGNQYKHSTSYEFAIK
ncbi:galactose-1-epimerase [Vibrio sp. 10N]|uniref:galactose-1-epimerase n=1 Tax=Vibrio sp. 10N TaxID=3058938 RepID=UPI00281448FC|nr:galactose-1-epimerase [Vibrio sp. 10N]